MSVVMHVSVENRITTCSPRMAGTFVQTLTDKEYQRLRDASVAIIREMGVECGGSNVQMAINPADGEVRLGFEPLRDTLSYGSAVAPDLCFTASVSPVCAC